MMIVPDTALAYLIRFPNGKHYVGITCQGMPRRLREHRLAKAGILRYALKKYGDDVQMLVLAEGSRNEMCELERFLIADMGTKPPHGYNLSDGGDGFSPKEMKQFWSVPAFRSRAIAGMLTTNKRQPRSAKHSNWLRKLTMDQANDMRKRVAGGERQSDLAREYRVSRSLVCMIWKGKRYAR